MVIMDGWLLGVCLVPFFCRVPSAEYYDCVVRVPSRVFTCLEPKICLSSPAFTSRQPFSVGLDWMCCVFSLRIIASKITHA